ncbi:TlpA disulfide reductase family protein [Treponema pedis]|uniref:Thioredoxin n=1 Tax=Treponema pedis str. T A4 TaxID=1291379 RepID=S6A8U8_9SPIR|nr:TlpA disulfide reductase family protein [Treponema pedis]AGT44454.1 thioredoxin [Treponema pedis str. T A4]
MKHSKIILAVLICAVIFGSCSKSEEMKPMEDSMSMEGSMSMNDNASSTAAPKKIEASASKSTVLEFSTIDLDGNTVTNEIFSKYDLTLVNVWGTFCGPCKVELPALEAAYKEYAKKNCNVIAITIDLSKEDTSTLDLAKEIWKDSGCTFKALYSVPEFAAVTDTLTGVPTSFFVDKKGAIVKGSFHTGALDLEGFKKFFDKHLGMMMK